MYDKSPLYFKLSLPSGLFWFLVPRGQQARKEVTTLAGATDPGHQEEVSSWYFPLHYEVNGQV